MLVTDNFIYIHQPKTGGTFIHDVLFNVYGIKWSWYHGVTIFFKKRVKYSTNHGELLIGGGKHDRCKDVPIEYLKGRRFLSNVRNPLDQYVSQFEFGWWKRKEYLKYYHEIPNFNEKFPTFPDLTFEEFMRLEYETYNDISKCDLFDQDGIGLQSVKFIRYFAKDAEELLSRMKSNNCQKEEILNALYPIDFLFTHRLNADIHDYLLKSGFEASKLAFIKNKEKVLPLGKGRSEDQKWQKYYSPKLLETVLRKDKILFDLFPEFMPKTTLPSK